VPAFRVRTVNVVGARYAEPEEIAELAAVDSEATVWDDPEAWESRVRAHPLVEEAEVRRRGASGLEIRIREVRPVALVATPVLVPVDADGWKMEIDAARHAIDLPILSGAQLDDRGRVEGEKDRRALEAIEEIRALDTTFVSFVSEIRPLEGDAVSLELLAGSRVSRVVLPLGQPVHAFLRVNAAVREAERRGPVASADARFRGEVVVRMREAG
jgi:hypothetical protein